MAKLQIGNCGRLADLSQVKKAVSIFKKAGVVIFPTDTVWGIGVNIAFPCAIEKLYQIKKRVKIKPTAVLVGSLNQAKELGEINDRALRFIQRFWPGALTVVVKAKKKVPEAIRGPGNTVGLRMPNHKIALYILKKLKSGLVTASANRASCFPPEKKEDIDKELIKDADFLVEGEALGNPPSTVVDTTERPFKVIRKGSVGPKELGQVILGL